jgi:C-terminal processing protease CtpA/Prc
MQSANGVLQPAHEFLLCLGRDDGEVTGYVAIQSFGKNTAHDAAAAITSLQQQGARSLILDLRGNTGGLVNAGVLPPSSPTRQ